MPRHDYLWQAPFSPRSGKITKDQIIESLQFLEMSRPQRVIPEYNNVMYTVAGEATTKGLNMQTLRRESLIYFGKTTWKQSCFNPLA